MGLLGHVDVMRLIHTGWREKCENVANVCIKYEEIIYERVKIQI